jgi:hypothetical protein
MNDSRYAPHGKSEEDKDFFDKYSATGESEWTRGSVTPFEDDVVLRERHYHTGRDYSGVGPLNYKRSDERIRDDVSDALYSSPEIDASDIEVDVKNGIVTLKGEVQSRLQKKIAEMTAERLPGVVDIDNLIIIQNPKTKGLMMSHTPVP